jgi:hypothetical protein
VAALARQRRRVLDRGARILTGFDSISCVCDLTKGKGEGEEKATGGEA